MLVLGPKTRRIPEILVFMWFRPLDVGLSVDFRFCSLGLQVRFVATGPPYVGRTYFGPSGAQGITVCNAACTRCGRVCTGDANYMIRADVIQRFSSLLRVCL